MVKLTSHVVKPFNKIADWSGKDEEGNFHVVTFTTISQELYSEWERQNLDNYHFKDGDIEIDGNSIENYNFDIPPPGVYRDTDKPNFKVPEGDKEEDWSHCYTIIVPFDFMSRRICNIFIEKLNDKYGTDFELYATCKQCGKQIPVGEDYLPEGKIPEEERWKTDIPFCSKNCYETYSGQENANMRKHQDYGQDSEEISSDSSDNKSS